MKKRKKRESERFIGSKSKSNAFLIGGTLFLYGAITYSTIKSDVIGTTIYSATSILFYLISYLNFMNLKKN